MRHDDSLHAMINRMTKMAPATMTAVPVTNGTESRGRQQAILFLRCAAGNPAAGLQYRPLATTGNAGNVDEP